MQEDVTTLIPNPKKVEYPIVIKNQASQFWCMLESLRELLKNTGVQALPSRKSDLTDLDGVQNAILKLKNKLKKISDTACEKNEKKKIRQHFSLKFISLVHFT